MIIFTPSFLQFIKYCFVGLLNTVVFYGIYYLLLQVSLSFVVAATVGNILAIMNSFLWNKFFTFKARKKVASETIRFLIVCLGQYLINLFIIAVCVNFAGITAEWGGVIAIAVSTFIAFFAHKYWSFRDKNKNL